MRAFASLRRFLGALIGALTGRRPRRTRADVPPVSNPVDAPATISGTADAEPLPANTPFESAEPTASDARTRSHTEALSQAHISSSDEPQADRHAPDDLNSAIAAGISVDLSTAPVSTPPETAGLAATMRDPSVHAVESADPPPIGDTRVDASPNPEMPESAESMPGPAAPSASTDEPAASTPVEDQPLQTVDTSKTVSTSMLAVPDVVEPSARETSPTPETLSEITVPATSAVTAGPSATAAENRPVEPVKTPPICDTRVVASPNLELPGSPESMPGPADPPTATNEAAPATAPVDDQPLQTVDTAKTDSTSIHAVPDVVESPAREVSPTPETLSEITVPETSAVTAVAPAAEAENRPAREPDIAVEGEEQNETKPVHDEGSPGAVTPPTIDEPEFDDVLLLEDEVDPGAEAGDLPEESEATGQPKAARTGQRRPSTWQRRPEPSSEYPVAALPAPSADYRFWNRAIAEHLLLKNAAGSDLYLTITPRILARAFAELQGSTLTAQEAEEHFVTAVSASYRTRILANRARLRVLRRTGDDGLPECIAFLGLTVLAAYRMHGDEEATGLAYYLRLGELLQCELSGPYPAGFDPVVFESLWFFLRDWLAQRGGRLALPAPEAGSRRFVGLPLAHVPLRSLDIEKLPGFFFWAGYQPSSEVTPHSLADDFARWVRARVALTPTGIAAFADARRSAVLAEIRAELDSWDGTCDESVSRRSASVEILFDPVQHRPELFYVPRRPPGFPARFDDGVHVFDGSDDGWYGRISIRPPDGPDLARGFGWHSAQSGVEFALRRAATSVISMVPGDDYSGFMSARGLRRNVPCAVLCQEDVAKTVAEYLSHVAERQCRPLQHHDLPTGWSLFPGISARRLAAAPAGLESLDIQANVGLIPSGGIRLGNRWSWLQGAPPRIIVTGSEPGIPITIDGSAATVDENGMLSADGSLMALGAHVIQVGPVRRTVEIVEPSLYVNSEHATEPVEGSAHAVLALPPGPWTVVGVIPGQVARPKHSLRQGAIVECNFAPSWAIRIGPNRGATVLNVSPGVPSLPESTRGKSVRALSSRVIFDWTSSIYTAAVRHPQIDSLIGERDQVALAASWKAYAQCASQIKRTIRSARR
jgi:hypothetical protein